MQARKILLISLWVVALLGTITLLGFASNTMNNTPCKSIDISIVNDNENRFVEADDVRLLLKEKNKKIIDQSMEKISTDDIEVMLNSNTHIANAEVFKTVNGELKINILPKRPIARIINYKGESFYLDQDGTLMKWSNKFTARLPVFTGNIYETYDRCYSTNFNMKDINDSVLIKNNLYGIYALAKYLDSHEFWKAEIEQVYIGEKVELVPKTGTHIVQFGNMSDIDEKLNKLLVFYQNGLSKVGWNIYSTINLEFKNQVVCYRYPKQLVKKKVDKIVE